MNVLVTGAAGYIGSHAVRRLAASGHTPIALDSLVRGHRASVPRDVPLIVVDVRSTETLTRVLAANDIDCVMHFAALADVAESVRDPLAYFDTNTGGVLSLLRAMDEAGVRRLVFSSTCATYGEPEQVPIVEDCPQRPINPYGRSKLFAEQLMADYAAREPRFSFAALRYFNVAGCSLDGGLGEDHEPETHLIPVVLKTALGQRAKVVIFGTDYATPDGTCIRDYVHVDDLTAAHVAAMDALVPGAKLHFNVGIGRGYSVREIVDTARAVTGKDFKIEIGPRRHGDPPRLFADPERIARSLGWRAKITDPAQIIESAWRWFVDHPQGYRDRA